jgi:hypothetical protein
MKIGIHSRPSFAPSKSSDECCNGRLTIMIKQLSEELFTFA